MARSLVQALGTAIKDPIRAHLPWLVSFYHSLPEYKKKYLIFKERREYSSLTAEGIFTRIYDRGTWATESQESLSGIGSHLANSAAIRAALPALLKEFKVRSLLDIPCGDFHWMKDVPLGVEAYIGADIVGSMIDGNRQRYTGRPAVTFCRLNLIDDPLPCVDLIFCRDCLVHLSFADIRKALANIKRSGARYLLTTTFTRREENRDIYTGAWRPLNLEKDPFRFSPPLCLVDENYQAEGGIFTDKAMGLWLVSALR